MKRPAVFFDRDNTLIVSDGYLGDPAKVALIAGAADAVARARGLGYAVVVFSNQSGVARGMFSEEDVQAVNSRMDELLAAENATAIIDRHEFCPFHPDGTVDVYARESDRRKPKPGMIHSAAKALALDLEQSWVIGDAGRDIDAARAAGCRAILFTDPSLRKSPAAESRPSADADYTVTTLGEALNHIEKAPLATQREAVVELTPVPEETPPVTAPPKAVEAAVAVDAAAPAKRVPKVAIGSKYVPPEGRDAPTGGARQAVAERPAAAATRKILQRATEDEAPPPAPPSEPGAERMEAMLDQIVQELRRQHEHGESEFSVSKLLAGVVQVLVLAVLFLGYLRRDAVQTYLMLAMVLQTMTIALLIMSRQK